MQSPDFNSLLWSQMNRNPASDLEARVGINGNRGPISFIPQPGTQPWTIGYQAGRSLPDMAVRHRMLRPLRSVVDNLGTNHMGASIAGAGIGGAIGAGTSLVSGGSMGRGAAVGAGLGGLGAFLLSLYAQNRLGNTQVRQAPLPNLPGRIKQSFYAVEPEAGQDISSKLMSDNATSYSDKTMLLNYVRNLPSYQQSDLSRLIGPAVGAGIGMLIAKYLLGLGIGGTALTALLGAGVGRQFWSGPRDAYGRSVNTHRDALGQSRFV